MKRGPVFIAILLINLGRASAQVDTSVCYILDGILFVYGIILTVLYCRLKMRFSSNNNAEVPKKSPEEGVYAGLTPHTQDTYETLKTHKK